MTRRDGPRAWLPDGRRRWVVMVVVVAMVAVVALVAAVALVSGRRAGAPGSDAGSATIPRDAAPDELRAQACGYLLGAFAEDIAEDAPAADVLERIRRAERQARSAAADQPRWIGLAGGISALRKAVEDDDARAADIALRVIHVECDDRDGRVP